MARNKLTSVAKDRTTGHRERFVQREIRTKSDTRHASQVYRWMRIEIFRICFDAAGHTLIEVIENKHDLSRDYFLCSPDVFYVLDAAPGADCHRRESEKEI